MLTESLNLKFIQKKIQNDQTEKQGIHPHLALDKHKKAK